MYRTANRKHSHSSHAHNNFDLYSDLEKIKNAFADTALDVKGKTEEMFTHSVDGIKEKSTQIKDNVADFTAEKPFKSLGAAVLIGFVIGFLVRK